MLFKKTLPYVVLLCLTFYALPLLMKDTGSAMLLLLLVMPLLTIVTSFRYGNQYGFHFMFSILVMVLFSPSVYLFYNSSALIYVVIFGAIAFVGNFLGAKTKHNSQVES